MSSPPDHPPILKPKKKSKKIPKPVPVQSGTASSDDEGPEYVGPRKLGHRKVDKETGEVAYKNVASSTLMQAIQMGIRNSVSLNAEKTKRDLLLSDFDEVESLSYPKEGTSITPAHHFDNFKFYTYAPTAFRHFRREFGIDTSDFLLSICDQPLRELQNPGASGSIFYLSHDDVFIIKTVQKGEHEFLRKLLPGYYMNLVQNKRTLLPKFFGLYSYNSLGRNIRFVIMTNILPSRLTYYQRYDLKGSTFGRKASDKERAKKSPTWKDLDFVEFHPKGLTMSPDTFEKLASTIHRDCLVLESFKIMDYSLLVGLHRPEKDPARAPNNSENSRLQDPSDAISSSPVKAAPTPRRVLGNPRSDDTTSSSTTQTKDSGPSRERHSSWSTSGTRRHSFRTREAIEGDEDGRRTPRSPTATMSDLDEEEDEEHGGLIALTDTGEKVYVYLGIIDILQQYTNKKKLEHTWKSIIHDGDTVSVHNPKFYSKRFLDFMSKVVFRPQTGDGGEPVNLTGSSELTVHLPKPVGNMHFRRRLLSDSEKGSSDNETKVRPSSGSDMDEPRSPTLKLPPSLGVPVDGTPLSLKTDSSSNAPEDPSDSDKSPTHPNVPLLVIQPPTEPLEASLEASLPSSDDKVVVDPPIPTSVSVDDVVLEQPRLPSLDLDEPPSPNSDVV